MTFCGRQAVLSVLILVVLGETIAGATPDEWLRESAPQARGEDPSADRAVDLLVSVTLSDPTCTGFAVGMVSSELGARNEASGEATP